MNEYPTFDRTIDSARMQLVGSLDGVVKHELWYVLKEFFDRTYAWRAVFVKRVYNHEPQSTSTVLTPRENATLISLIAAWVADCHRDGPNNSVRPFDGQIPNATIVPAVFSLPDLVTLARGAAIPRAAQAGRSPAGDYTDIAFLMALSVADPTGEDGIPHCPAWTETRYGEVILSGLLSRMMMQPQKPYTNLAGAQFHGQRFRMGVSHAKNEIAHNNIRGGQTWQFPTTFRTRRRGY